MIIYLSYKKNPQLKMVSQSIAPLRNIASSALLAASPEMARWIISTVSSAKASPGGGRNGGFFDGKNPWRTSSIEMLVLIYIYMCMFSWKKSWRNCECHMKLTCTLAFYMFLLNSPWNEDFKQTNKLVSSSKMGIWLIHDLNWCKNTAAEIDFSGIIWGTVQMGTLWDIWNIT